MDEKTRQELLKEMSEEELKRYEEELKIINIKNRKREEMAKVEKAKFIKMSREDKLKLCRFYKGQKDNPYKGTDVRNLFWMCEERYANNPTMPNWITVDTIILVDKESHKQIHVLVAYFISRNSDIEGSDRLNSIYDKYLSMKP